VAYLERAVELLQKDGHDGAQRHRRRWLQLDRNAGVDTGGRDFHLARIEAGLSESHFRIGNLGKCREHSARALDWIDQPTPTRRVGWITGALRETAVRMLQRLAPTRPASAASTEVATIIAPVEGWLTEAYFYALDPLPIVWLLLRIVNRCEPVGPSPALGQAYMLLAILAETVPLRRLATTWRERSLDIAQVSGPRVTSPWRCRARRSSTSGRAVGRNRSPP
jgi:hypothetical protein